MDVSSTGTAFRNALRTADSHGSHCAARNPESRVPFQIVRPAPDAENWNNWNNWGGTLKGGDLALQCTLHCSLGNLTPSVLVHLSRRIFGTFGERASSFSFSYVRREKGRRCVYTLIVTILRMMIHPIITMTEAPARHTIPLIDVKNGIIIPGFITVITPQRKNGMSDTIMP